MLLLTSQPTLLCSLGPPVPDDTTRGLALLHHSLTKKTQTCPLMEANLTEALSPLRFPLAIHIHLALC